MPSATRRALVAGAAFALAMSAFGAQAADTLTIAYQTAVEPSKIPQADKTYEKATGQEIAWRKFDSGADVIAAIASGDVQIGYVGSSPLAAAASRQLPIKTIFVVGLIGDAEALVARNGSKVESLKDLEGKKVAVPFVSTTHYSLLAALKHEGVSPKSLDILNLRPPEIVAAWQRGDIDAAYVWDPALGKLKENGRVVVDSKTVAGWGAPTFDAWIVRADYAEKNPAVVRAFVEVTGQAYADYRKNPDAWSATSEQAKTISRLTGAKADEVPALLKGYHLPLLEEQASAELLGGGLTKAIADTAAFLKEQGKVPAVLPDYGPYVTATFAREALAAN